MNVGFLVVNNFLLFKKFFLVKEFYYNYLVFVFKYIILKYFVYDVF